MAITAKQDFNQLIEEAEAAVTTLDAAEARELVGDESALLVDLRDVRELEREGRIPGSFHMPRGMLEFWVHPQSPYFKPVFAEPRRFVFYCNKGWRSALAARAAEALGLENVAHVGGGFEAWREAGGAVEEYVRRRR